MRTVLAGRRSCTVPLHPGPQAGVLRTLGTRSGGALAAYDHGELGCGLLPETSDFSAAIAEPGSFYFLVGSTVNGSCAGLGRADRPVAGGREHDR